MHLLRLMIKQGETKEKLILVTPLNYFLRYFLKTECIEEKLIYTSDRPTSIVLYIVRDLFDFGVMGLRACSYRRANIDHGRLKFFFSSREMNTEICPTAANCL